MIDIAKRLARHRFVVATIVWLFAVGSAHAAYVPPTFRPLVSIPTPGLPEFTGAVQGSAFYTKDSHSNVTGLEINFSQVGKTGTFYSSPTSAYTVSNETFTFRAVYDLSGHLKSGSRSVHPGVCRR